MNDTLAVIACAALGCGCGDPTCLTVVNAVLVASGTLPQPAKQDSDRRESGDYSRLSLGVGVTVCELSVHVNVFCYQAGRYVNKIEAGRYGPPLSTLNSIAKGLGAPVTELLG
jgi:hypothetical protein